MHDVNLDKPTSVDAHWKPVASLEQLRARSKAIRLIRSFFEAKDVLEVETPFISPYGNPDPLCHPVGVQWQSCEHGPTLVQHKGWLHTSPELAMKRLLCSLR